MSTVPLPRFLASAALCLLAHAAMAQTEAAPPVLDSRLKQCAESSVASGLTGRAFDEAVQRCALKTVVTRASAEESLTRRILTARDLSQTPDGKAFSAEAYRTVVTPIIRQCRPAGIAPETLPPLRVVASIQAGGLASNVVVQAGGAMRQCVQSSLESARWPVPGGKLTTPHPVSFDIYFAPPATGR